jgi:hypothetical protein
MMGEMDEAPKVEDAREQAGARHPLRPGRAGAVRTAGCPGRRQRGSARGEEGEDDTTVLTTQHTAPFRTGRAGAIFGRRRPPDQVPGKRGPVD